MTVTYEQLGSAGEHYPTRIDYTGKASPAVTPYASVRFEYESRPDVFVGYTFGFKQSVAKRLKYIRTYHGSSILRTYTLAYTFTGPSSRTILSSVTETGQDGISFKPLSFLYENGSSSWVDAPSDFLPPTSAEISKGIENGSVGLVDLDGDGYSDYVQSYIVDGSSTLIGNAWLNRPSGWVATSAYKLKRPLAIRRNGSMYDTGGRFVDVNGDGLVDFVYGYSDTSNSTHSVRETYLNTGTGFSATPSTQWQLPVYVRARANYGEHKHRHFVDINGDGLTDFVYNNEYLNDGNKGAYLNTGSGWSYNASWIPYLVQNQDEHSIFIDVNGDGLPDQLQRQLDWTAEGVAINRGVPNGSGTHTAWNLLGRRPTGNGQVLVVNHSDFYKYRLPRDIAAKGSNMYVYGTEVADLNGDGLPDMLYYDTNVASGVSEAWLNTGNGWTPNNAYSSPVKIGHNGANQGVGFLDVNGDGIPDLLKNDNGSVAFHYGTGSGFGSNFSYLTAPYHLDGATGNAAEAAGSLFGDINGDGLVDQVWYKKNSSGTTLSRGAKLNNWGQTGRLWKVTNAFGVSAEINYAPLTERDAANNFLVYTKGTGLAAGQSHVMGPMYVVESVTHEDGAGGSKVVEYAYSGLRAQHQRGMLGFEKVVALESRVEPAPPAGGNPLNVLSRSTTQYAQAWPYIGMPVSSVTEVKVDALGWRKVADSSAFYKTVILDYAGYNPISPTAPALTLADSPVIAVNSKKTILPYAWQSFENGYNPDDSSLQSPAALSKKKTTLSSPISAQTPPFDGYGNTLSIEIDTTGPDNRTHKLTTTSEYTNNATTWRLGRLTESAALQEYYDTTIPGNASNVRAASFLYNAQGLLATEVVDPDGEGHIDNTYLRTDYTYDSFGNVITKTVKGGGLPTAGRAVTTQYDSKGRFPIWTDNALGHRETYSYNPWWGAPNSQTGPNGLTTSWTYDGFGRPTRETRPDTTVSETRRRWAGYAAPSGSVFLVETESTGAPPALEFYDKYGRPIYSLGVNGGINGVAQIGGAASVYDAQGRQAIGYRPFRLPAATTAMPACLPRKSTTTPSVAKRKSVCATTCSAPVHGRKRHTPTTASSPSQPIRKDNAPTPPTTTKDAS